MYVQQPMCLQYIQSRGTTLLISSFMEQFRIFPFGEYSCTKVCRLMRVRDINILVNLSNAWVSPHFYGIYISVWSTLSPGNMLIVWISVTTAVRRCLTNLNNVTEVVRRCLTNLSVWVSVTEVVRRCLTNLSG